MPLLARETTPMDDPTPHDSGPNDFVPRDLTPVSLMRIVSVKTAAEMRQQSQRAIRRQFAGQMVKLGPRRGGLRMHQVLELPAPRLSK
jgi:hypothetical protein